MFRLQKRLIREVGPGEAVGSGPGQRTFCVGDIHGCSKELNILLDHLRISNGLCQQDLVIFLGDYIDRGPNSREVVSSLINFKKLFPRTIFLRGNHEDTFLDYVGLGGSYGWAWLSNGGAQLLASYGISLGASKEEILRLIPEEHIAFFRKLDFGVELDNYIVVHAGINPNRAIHQQISEDLLWIRDKFIYSPHKLGKPVIFGHTIFESLFLDLPYKIGIDTGLVYGNSLSCIELSKRRLLEVKRWGSSLNESCL